MCNTTITKTCTLCFPHIGLKLISGKYLAVLIGIYTFPFLDSPRIELAASLRAFR